MQCSETCHCRHTIYVMRILCMPIRGVDLSFNLPWLLCLLVLPRCYHSLWNICVASLLHRTAELIIIKAKLRWSKPFTEPSTMLPKIQGPSLRALPNICVQFVNSLWQFNSHALRPSAFRFASSQWQFQKTKLTTQAVENVCSWDMRRICNSQSVSQSQHFTLFRSVICHHHHHHHHQRDASSYISRI